MAFTSPRIKSEGTAFRNKPFNSFHAGASGESELEQFFQPKPGGRCFWLPCMCLDEEAWAGRVK